MYEITSRHQTLSHYDNPEKGSYLYLDLIINL